VPIRLTPNAGIKSLRATLPAEIFTGILIFKGLTARCVYKSFGVNGLTPELNPSAQRFLTKFFTGDFNF
jgi:hypothetical protein